LLIAKELVFAPERSTILPKHLFGSTTFVPIECLTGAATSLRMIPHRGPSPTVSTAVQPTPTPAATIPTPAVGSDVRSASMLEPPVSVVTETSAAPSKLRHALSLAAVVGVVALATVSIIVTTISLSSPPPATRHNTITEPGGEPMAAVAAINERPGLEPTPAALAPTSIAGPAEDEPAFRAELPEEAPRDAEGSLPAPPVIGESPEAPTDGAKTVDPITTSDLWYPLDDIDEEVDLELKALLEPVDDQYFHISHAIRALQEPILSRRRDKKHFDDDNSTATGGDSCCDSSMEVEDDDASETRVGSKNVP